jgi:hypothetical protein
LHGLAGLSLGGRESENFGSDGLHRNVRVDTDIETTLALFRSWLTEDSTGAVGAIRKADRELIEFKRNLNAPRKEAGERILFPEAESDA